VIDRHGDVLAVQITTLGMEVRKELLGQAIREVFEPSAAVLRSEGRNRQLEGLDDERAVWFGAPPEHVDIDEYGVTFRVPLLGGQKTGHFYDQADNRRFAGGLCRGLRVLDVYANGGGWALHALRNGASAAVAVDKSAEACAMMRTNAELNGVALDVIEAEGKRTLQDLLQAGQQFGAVVLDPPAFAKTRKAAGSALRGYRDINALGMGLLEPGGLLFTSSCSYHVHEDRFLEALTQAAGDAGRRLRVVRRGEQSPDHAIDPTVPETRYLKSWAFTVDLDSA
jgi:23S rRNA (cytosine1962-C5)-methyltransferase